MHRVLAPSRNTYLSTIHSKAIILILHIRMLNRNPHGLPHVKSIRIMPAILPIALGIINSYMIQHEIIRLNTKCLHGRILNIKPRDDGIIQTMCIEELGLGLAAIATFAIPPLLAAAVDNVARVTADGDAVALDAN